jgi:hypothetical protein
MIAKIDEQQITVVALSMNPARHADVLAHVLRTELVVLMSAIFVRFDLAHVILGRGALFASLTARGGPTPAR